VRVRHRTRREAALILRVVGDARDREDEPELRDGERVRRLVRVHRLRGLAVDEDPVPDHALRAAEVGIPQPARPVEVVDRHADGRVRRQVPDRLALPLALVVLDEVRDPVRVLAQLRPDGGHGLDRQVDDLVAAHLLDRDRVGGRSGERRELRGVEADENTGDRDRQTDEQELHADPHRWASYQAPRGPAAS
jgi:hypothetical protein